MDFLMIYSYSRTHLNIAFQHDPNHKAGAIDPILGKGVPTKDVFAVIFRTAAAIGEKHRKQGFA